MLIKIPVHIRAYQGIISDDIIRFFSQFSCFPKFVAEIVGSCGCQFVFVFFFSFFPIAQDDYEHRVSLKPPVM